MADFTAEQVATWLEEANGFRRARWVHLPNAKALAADLSAIDFTDRFTAHHQVTRQVRQITGMLRRLAGAWDDPDLSDLARRTLIGGIGPALYVDAGNRDDGRLVAQQVAELITGPDFSERCLEQWLDQRVAQKFGQYRSVARAHGRPGRVQPDAAPGSG